MIRQPILVVFVVLGLGVALGDRVEPGSMIAGCAALVAAALTVVAWRKGSGTAIAALLTLFLCGIWAATLHPPPPPLEHRCGETTPWRGTVDAPIERRWLPEEKRLLRRTVLTDLEQACDDTWHSRPGRLAVSLWGDTPVARGDTIEARLSTRTFQAPRNPFVGDQRQLARRRNLAARGLVRSPHAITHHGRSPLATLDRLREQAAARLERNFPAALSPLAKALALGDRGSITPQTRDRWADAGIAHLLAISGLHVGIITALAFFLLRLATALLPGAGERFSTRRLAATATIPLAVLFCLWTGASPSAVRATIMAVAFLLGYAAGRPSAAPNALGVAGAGILLADPTSLYDASFLLSFAAVAALLLMPPFERGRTLARRALTYLIVCAVASVVATVATAPITAYHFGRVSLAAPLVNMVAVPVGALVATPLALAYAALAPLSSGVEWFLGGLLGIALRALDTIANVGAAIPLAALDLPRPTGLEIAAYVALLITAVLTLRARRHRWLPATLLALLLASAAWRLAGRYGDGELHVITPYVGQGDATLMILPDGGVMLIDAGGSYDEDDWDPGREVLAPLLRGHAIRTIDIAVITHPDPDHLGGFVHLSERFKINQLWHNGAPPNKGRFHTIVANVEAAGGKVISVAEVPRALNAEGVALTVPHPRAPEDEGGAALYELDANDNSVVLRAQLGERSILLPGDVEETAEEIIAPLIVAADILKAPHHGSRTSSTDPFVAAADPKLVLFHCGHENRFGFPHPDVVERYRERGVRTLRTDIDGAIEMVTDGARWRIQTYRGKELSVP